MASTDSRNIFVNLAVRDLQRSKNFFSKLGFGFNPQFTDEKAACIIVNDEGFVMLSERDKGKVLVPEGPFAETREWIGGFDLLERADRDEAVKIAAKHPMARFGRIEVHPCCLVNEQEKHHEQRCSLRNAL